MLKPNIGTATLYHLSPRKFRPSIHLRGLRVSSWTGADLTTWAVRTPPDAKFWDHIARRHECRVDQLDLWEIRVHKRCILQCMGNIVSICCDVTSLNTILMRDKCYPVEKRETESCE